MECINKAKREGNAECVLRLKEKKKEGVLGIWDVVIILISNF